MIKKYFVITGNIDEPGTYNRITVEGESANSIMDEEWQGALRKELKEDGHSDEDISYIMEDTTLVGVFPATDDFVLF